MGIFGNSSPFDADVERATSENNTSEEWGLILEICDRASTSAQNSRDCLRAVLRRLGHHDPHVQVHAATLLDACVANCGRVFHLEVASREFETEFRRLVSRAQPAVASRLRALVRKWAEGEFKSDPQLDLIPALAKQLRAEAGERDAPSHSHHHHSHHSHRDGSANSEAAAAAAAQREQEELARAIALSLRESTASAANTTSALYPKVEDAAAAPPAPPPARKVRALYDFEAVEENELSFVTGDICKVEEAAAAPPAPPPARKVRALYDFEAVEENELSFVTGDILHVIDSSDANWWKGYSERGEGLFPANFVTSDLTEPEPKKEIGAKTVQFSDSTAKAVEEEPVEIDEHAMDAALAMLHDADVEARSDESALQALEGRVLRMGPLVDAALERADTRHARLTQLSAELVRALNLYHELMRDPTRPAHAALGPPPPPPPQPQPQPPYMPPQMHMHPPPPRC